MPRPVLSIITPAYNEAANIELAFDRIKKMMEPVEADWEWIVVDDHSADNTFEVTAALHKEDHRVRIIRLSRNFGAHLALMCGMEYMRGDCAVLLAADMQDSTELVPRMLKLWEEGTQIVWAVRARRPGDNFLTIGFSSLYNLLMRRIFGLNQMPPGAGYCLMDRRVVEAVCQYGERNISLLALVAWIGFRQKSLEYDRQARIHGRSGWNLEKKIKLLVDSITAFSYLPIRLMSYFGVCVSFLGFVYAALVVKSALRGVAVEGWSSLMVVILILSGTQILMLGVLGEYIWRSLDEARRRPRYLIEEAAGVELHASRV